MNRSVQRRKDDRSDAYRFDFKEYEIKKILDHRRSKKGIEHRVQWVHDSDPTWEPMGNFYGFEPLLDYWSAKTDGDRQSMPAELKKMLKKREEASKKVELKKKVKRKIRLIQIENARKNSAYSEKNSDISMNKNTDEGDMMLKRKREEEEKSVEVRKNFRSRGRDLSRRGEIVEVLGAHHGYDSPDLYHNFQEPLKGPDPGGE